MSTFSDEIANLPWKFGGNWANGNDELVTHFKSLQMERQLCENRLQSGHFGVYLHRAKVIVHWPLCRLLVACMANDPR